MKNISAKWGVLFFFALMIAAMWVINLGNYFYSFLGTVITAIGFALFFISIFCAIACAFEAAEEQKSR